MHFEIYVVYKTNILFSYFRLQFKLEGVVSKRRDFPDRSGHADWIKVKCLTWREENKDRWELFNKHKRR